MCVFTSPVRERAGSGDARPRRACLPQTRSGSQQQRRVQVTGGFLGLSNWSCLFLSDSGALGKTRRRIQPVGGGEATGAGRIGAALGIKATLVTGPAWTVMELKLSCTCLSH